MPDRDPKTKLGTTVEWTPPSWTMSLLSIILIAVVVVADWTVGAKVIGLVFAIGFGVYGTVLALSERDR